MTQEIAIVRAESKDIESLVNFQLLLGKETENMELDANILSQAIKYLVEELQDQFYLVAKIGDEVAGCIMTVVQNKQKAWIQSVYVHSEHRKKGIFKRLYNQLCDMQKKKGIKMMYLYAEEENEKALATYHKLGMEIVKGMSMYGYDFIYNNDILPQRSKDYIIKHQAISNDNHNLVDIFKTGSDNNKPLSVFDQQRLVGYMEYFEQFSDWRYGRTINITKLFLQDNRKQVLASILNYLKQKSPGLSVSAIRFFVSQESTLKEIFEVPRLHYYVLSIDL